MKNRITSVGEALSVLIQAIEIASSKNVFDVYQSVLIAQAIEFLVPDYIDGKLDEMAGTGTTTVNAEEGTK